jgi:hypothetical protein
MKQMPSFLSDSSSHLESELELIKGQMRVAARRGDETALAALRSRRDELPGLIQAEKMRDFAARLSVARSRVAALNIELQNAVRESLTLATKVETDVPLLQEAIENLRSVSAQAHHERDLVQFAAKQADDELVRIQNERESLLLAQFGTN